MGYNTVTMNHPHAALLQEFRICLQRLVPLTPQEVVDEGRRLADELEADENATIEQIRQALIYVGKKEFPYRKAYEALCAQDEEARMQEIVLKKLDASILQNIEAVTKHGVHILDFVKSAQFEALDGQDRHAIDTAILEAHEQLDKQCDERAVTRKATYEGLVQEWSAVQERMQAMIEVLRGMADRDEKWHDEIIGKVRQFEEGWSVVERDPTEEELSKELEYWAGVLGESDDAEVLE